MATILKCDKCHRDNEGKSFIDIVPVKIIINPKDENDEDYSATRVIKDLCKNCRVNLLDFLKPDAMAVKNKEEK